SLSTTALGTPRIRQVQASSRLRLRRSERCDGPEIRPRSVRFWPVMRMNGPPANAATPAMVGAVRILNGFRAVALQHLPQTALVRSRQRALREHLALDHRAELVGGCAGGQRDPLRDG